MKAKFWQRLLAFFLDIIIISVISTLIYYPFSNNENLKKLQAESDKISEQFVNQEIDMNTYINRTVINSHDVAYEEVIYSIIYIVITTGYFIILQKFLNGQTLGKKLMKIKLVNINKKELTINDLIFRAFIIDSLLINIIMLAVVILGNIDSYLYTNVGCEIVQFLLLVICASMVLFRKDRRGLHDLVAHTEVISVEEEVK